KNPLIVTDKGSPKLPFISNLQSYLSNSNVKSDLFFDISPNPREDEVSVGCKKFKDGNHDAIIAIGGGSEIFSFYSIFPIMTAFAWAISVIILKFIPEGHSTAKIQLYSLIFNVLGGLVLFFITSGHVEIKNVQDFFLMTLTGILGGTAAILFIYSYRLISASKMASFEYLGIPSSFVLGWIFFNEAPWAQLFPGVILIILAGMIIIWRDKVNEKSIKGNKQIN
ncbi:iron-containing alcohol dehydrogenase, partial [Candidatus Pelagibacter sp.]|nr:iron-containing alcohol dehydrogenase [Candidatus Pelagibacter sp.]